MSQRGREALPQAFFVPTETHALPAGQRLCLFHPPVGLPRGRVLYLHPFAEELNTTRRVVAQQARALAAAGYAVLQIDMTGCGDSTGDFADATWTAWLEDARLAHRWLSQSASGPLWLWGMRSGALLATDLLDRLSEPANLLLWQPAVTGQQVLQQFARLHAANQWLSAGKADEESPTRRLAQGVPVDIAGYTIHPELAAGLVETRLKPPTAGLAGTLIWMEIARPVGAALSPASEREILAWQQAGWHTRAEAVVAPPFWQTVSTEDAPALIQATLAAMAASAPRPDTARLT